MLTLGVTVLEVIVTVFDVAVVVVAQDALLVIVHVIVLPDTNVLSLYVAEFVPTFVPFFFHWYAGVVPPLVGVAVNVTFVPAVHNDVVDAEIDTLGVTFAFTVTELLLEFAIVVVAQLTLLVNATVMISVDSKALLA
jgi:hypothetical protein